MITSQRPLMLDAAVSLAQLVKEQTDMTWNNPDKVQRYIAKLQQHVEQLARQNNKLVMSNSETLKSAARWHSAPKNR